ncbi:MAG: VWA domain-containing protein [Kofleriaceae bacterium]
MRVALAVVVMVFSSVAYADTAFVVVVDRTLQPDKMAVITHALVSTLDTFDPDDEVAIVSYGKRGKVEVGLVSVKSRDRISRAVANIAAAAESDTAAGLRVAGDLLARSKRQHKRILLVTETSTGRHEPVLAKLRKQGIVTSALGYQVSSRAALDRLAKAGGGFAYPLRLATDVAASIGAAASTKPPPSETLAVVLVIDRSGSMGGPKLEAAKEAARATVEVLAPGDTIAVVAFDTESYVVVPSQSASNKMRISTEVSQIVPGGGTNIYPGLKEAYAILGQARATRKHVILLSDGEAPYDGLLSLVKEMKAAGITVSSVGLAGADRTLLSGIADAGEGRLYMVADVGTLPRIFIKETAQ